MYLEYIIGLHGNRIPILVVLRGNCHKGSRAKRRRLHAYPSADVLISHQSPVPPSKDDLLTNTKNKQYFINLLGYVLENAGIRVVHAIEEGGVDVLIVNEALTLATHVENIQVVADDTDILVLLPHHATECMEVSLPG